MDHAHPSDKVCACDHVSDSLLSRLCAECGFSQFVSRSILQCRARDEVARGGEKRGEQMHGPTCGRVAYGRMRDAEEDCRAAIRLPMFRCDIAGILPPSFDRNRNNAGGARSPAHRGETSLCVSHSVGSLVPPSRREHREKPSRVIVVKERAARFGVSSTPVHPNNAQSFHRRFES